MNNFKRLKFGSVPLDFIDPQINTTEQILISYLRTTFSPTILLDTESAIEVFKLSRGYIGTNFRNWLIVNYGNGSGARAGLCKAIYNWVNRKVSGKAVTSEIRRDLNRIEFLQSTEDQLQFPILNNGTEEHHTPISFEGIEDRHYFEFLGLIGPELTANFLLSLNGVRFKK